MTTYNTNRNAFFKSINIFSLRKIFFKNNHYTEKVIFYKAYTSINSKKWITIKLPDPKYTVRSIYTPDTKPKSTRYAITSSKALNQRYIFTPVNGYDSINNINANISKQYTNTKFIYYDLHIASNRLITLSLLTHTSRKIHINIQNYYNVNTINSLISKNVYSFRYSYVDSDYISYRYVISPTYSFNDKKIITVINIYNSLDIVNILNPQRYASNRYCIVKADKGQTKYIFYNSSSNHLKHDKRYAYWQPIPKHITTRYIFHKIPNYNSINTVYMYQGTKYWIDRYIHTQWFIYNSVRYIHLRYKFNDPVLTIGSSDSDILYSKNMAPKCFKFNFGSYDLKVFNIYDNNINIQKFEKCKPIVIQNTTMIGAIIDHKNTLEVAQYLIEAFTSKGHRPKTNIKIKKYQTSLQIKVNEKNDRKIIYGVI